MGSNSFKKKTPSAAPVTTGKYGTSAPFFQPKLTVGPADDGYEREADSVADSVMRMGDEEHIQTKISPVDIQRKCAHCEEEEALQRKENPAAGADGMDNYVERLSSGGQSLSKEVRSFFEPRLGYDFSNVKIHTGTIAAKSAESIGALAYTSGSSIVFNSGQYAPDTTNGKRLLGHELTHVVQQGGATKDHGNAGGKVLPQTSKKIQRYAGCTGAQNRIITSALARARRRSARAIQALADLISGANAAASRPLARYFGALTPAQISTVHSRMVAADIQLHNAALWRCDTGATYPHCGPPDNWCAGTLCPSPGAVTHLCPPFFRPSAEHACAEPSHAILVQHEALRAAGACGGYNPPGDRTPPGSLGNVYSYSHFMYSVASGARE